MNVSLNIHQIKKIVSGRIRERKQGNRVYYVKQITIISGHGERFDITLFADYKENIRQ